MTFWPLTNSDFPTGHTFDQFHNLDTELNFHWIMSGFHGAFATGMASHQGTLTLPDTRFRTPFWDLLVLQLLRPDSSNLPCLYSTFTLNTPGYFLHFAFDMNSVNWLIQNIRGEMFFLCRTPVLKAKHSEHWEQSLTHDLAFLYIFGRNINISNINIIPSICFLDLNIKVIVGYW